MSEQLDGWRCSKPASQLTGMLEQQASSSLSCMRTCLALMPDIWRSAALQPSAVLSQGCAQGSGHGLTEL